MSFHLKKLFSISLGTSILIFQPLNNVSANPISITVNGTTYSVGTKLFTDYESDDIIISNQLWWGNSSLAEDFANTIKGDQGLDLWNGSPPSGAEGQYSPIFAFSEPEEQKLLFALAIDGTVSQFYLTNTYDNFWTDPGLNYYAYAYLADTGDATYSISGTTAPGNVLTAAVSSDDPDGNGTVSSFTWQSSSDGSTWTDISGASSSSFTVTSAEEGKYVRVIIVYTDRSSTSETVTASSVTISHVDDGDAVFAISGSTSAGKVLTTSLSSSDPDGDGTFSYVWQSSIDGTTWSDISGATSSTYTLTEEEEGKYVRVTIVYTDGSSTLETVTVSSGKIPHVDSGDAVFAISGSTYAGKVLTTSLSSSDPDGDGTFSYVWQSSIDGKTWKSIKGATSSTYTLTEEEEGKYVRLVVSYTDAEGFTEVVLGGIAFIPKLNTDWVQPYAAMQNVGLKSIHNNRDLVLAKAGECYNYGWVIDDSDYCVYTNAKNKVSYVNGDTTRGSYGSALFNSSLNLEKTINEKWKAGIAYGVGSSNLYDFDFSSTIASLNSTNTHYSIYGVKKVNDTFTLKGMIGGSDFDYKGKRNYLTTTATSAYDTDGYTVEINGNWDIKKTIKNMKTPIRLKPSVGVAYAAHTQDGFSESGSGDLITIEANQAESLLFKTGIGIDKQIPMEGGKWVLVPSIALNYEVDPYADDDNRGLKGSLTESSTAATRVSAKNFGEQTGSVKVGADFVLNKDFMFNLNAEYGLATNGDEHSYGGGFSWQF